MFTCSASPAGSWPSLLKARGNTPPLIKLMSVEIAIFNHFDILGTKKMLFPPSGGLDSIKAAPSVKINTLLGGWFFSPSPLERVTAAKGCLHEESCTADCLTSALLLLICLQNACTWKSVSSPAVWRGCSCAGIPPLIPALCSGSGNTESVPAAILGALPLLFAGAGEHCGCQTAFEQLLFALWTVFPFFLGTLTDAFWVPRVLSTPKLLVTKEADPSPFW